jgi:4-hydroxybenzoate polyprenyltransferase
MLSVVALALAAIYPFTKRFFTHAAGVAGRGVRLRHPDGVRRPHRERAADRLGAARANVFWTIAYDTEYAMVDRDDDVKLGIRTSAILFGRFDVFAVMAC